MDDLMKAITTDEYAGQGGSFIYDPKTGKRMPAEEEKSKQVAEEVLSKE